MNTYCVYAHVALENLTINGISYEKDEVLYIGSGRVGRVNDKTGRSATHIEVWDKLYKYILHNNLNHEEKFLLEQEELSKHFGSGKILNKKSKVNKPQEILFSEFSEYFYIDSGSPSYLKWLKNKSTKKQGQPAGYLNKAGYWVIGFNHRFYLAHRIIWALQNKTDCPVHLVVDHIDGNKYEIIGKNNNPSNLRIVEHAVNTRNRLPGKLNTSGTVGVSWVKEDKAWVVRMKVMDTKISKYFTPNKLFPGEEFEKAKEKAKILAEQYRKELELCYNSTPSQ